MPDQQVTTVTEVDMNLDDILGTPGADNILLPTETEQKPSVFTSNKVDTSFLNKPDEPVEKTEKTEPVVETPVNQEEINEVLEIDTTEEATEKSTGRPKVEKNGVVELTKKLIENGSIMPFDEDKPIEEYTIKDFEELFEANFNEREKKIKETVPGEFFDTLPRELQYAAKYVADGGTDLKGLFKTLAVVEEVKALDPTDEMDQENIIRTYLHATRFGTAEDIEDEIDGWRQRGELEQKANKFKPKLDELQQEIVAQKLEEQEYNRKKQQAQAQKYIQNVYNVLEPGELNGIKLDKKTQNLLYTGLIQPQYQSITGQQTNLLGHLLEKYQYVEPNHALIAEALWLLSDPEGYREKLKETGKKETTEKHVRMLKTEQANKLSSTTESTSEERGSSTQKRGIPRPSQNFFKR